MKLRPLLVSIALLAPISIAVWWLGRPDASATPDDPRLGQRVAEAATIESAAQVEIKSDGKTLSLKRTDSGRWILQGTPDLPADQARLARLSNDLVTPKIERFVSARPEKLATYDLDQSSVTYRDASGKSLFTLHLGKSAEGGGRILRLNDEPRAYLARLALTLDTESSGWRDSSLFSGIAASDIASIRIGFTTTDAPVTLTREKADQPWTSSSTPAGQRVKASSLTTQAGNLSTLRYTAVKPNLDPDAVAARVFPREIVLSTFAGRTVTLSFGRAPEPPAPPTPPQKEGETPPPAPAAAPRPVYVTVVDSQPDPTLAEAGKTHAFEVAEWIYTALPAAPSDLFEPDPNAAQQPEAAPVAKSDSVSVVTPPLTATDPAATQAP